MNEGAKEERPRYVFNTNVLVSALLFSTSMPGRAVFTALERGIVLASSETVTELAEVVARPKFDRYIEAEERGRFLTALVGRSSSR